jgi:hypothetical protein
MPSSMFPSNSPSLGLQPPLLLVSFFSISQVAVGLGAPSGLQLLGQTVAIQVLSVDVEVAVSVTVAVEPQDVMATVV